jgi:hypothetical protein
MTGVSHPGEPHDPTSARVIFAMNDGTTVPMPLASQVWPEMMNRRLRGRPSAAELRSTVCHPDLQTIREGALHHVSRQIVPPVRFAWHATNLRATAIDRIGRTAYIGTGRYLSSARR